MFWYCEEFNQPLNNWNVQNVQNMKGIFCGCYEFNKNFKFYIKSNMLCGSY